MNASKAAELRDSHATRTYYDERYADGYMKEWPDAKKRKIREVLLSLPLPPHGSVLDYGCGNGVLTEVIGQTLPNWTVCGADLSGVAVANATLLYPNRKFFVPGDPAFEPRSFDLVISHHVLEHVHDVGEVLKGIERYLKPKASMLHILPCGNEGSFSHRLATLRIGGIDPEIGNRFFFEDEGHLRRMSTVEMELLCAGSGFQLESDYYGGQYYGSIDYFTKYEPNLIPLLCDWRRGINLGAKCEIFRIGLYLRSIAACRKFAQRSVRWQRSGSGAHRLLLALSAPVLLLARGVDRFITTKAEAEWRTNKSHRNGGEMFLYFTRDQRQTTK